MGFPHPITTEKTSKARSNAPTKTPASSSLPASVDSATTPGLTDIPRLLHQLLAGAEKLRSVKFSDFLTTFECTVLPTLRPSTQEIYRFNIDKHLRPAFGDNELHRISRADLEKFLKGKLNADYAPGTVAKLRNQLSKILQSAVESDVVFENAARRVKVPPMSLRRPRVFLTAEQSRRLLKLLVEPTRTMALLALMTGMRKGEILGLRWRDVDLTAGQLRVEQTWCSGEFGPPKTAASRREIPLAPGVVNALRRHQRRHLSPRGAGVVPRELLYKKVWRVPMQKLAREFGISDVGLGKLCRRRKIPIPPIGYWLRLRVGQRPDRTALPPLESPEPNGRFSPDSLVFSSRNGTPLNADNIRKRELAAAARQLGLARLGWHTFRHTHASLLHANGVPLKTISDILGHTTMRMVDRVYVHSMPWGPAQGGHSPRISRPLADNQGRHFSVICASLKPPFGE